MAATARSTTNVFFHGSVVNMVKRKCRSVVEWEAQTRADNQTANPRGPLITQRWATPAANTRGLMSR